ELDHCTGGAVGGFLGIRGRRVRRRNGAIVTRRAIFPRAGAAGRSRGRRAGTGFVSPRPEGALGSIAPSGRGETDQTAPHGASIRMNSSAGPSRPREFWTHNNSQQMETPTLN